MRAHIKDNATKIVFMAAVFSFLGVSIPKVASVFHIYEPGGLIWWVFAYLAAAGIDILAGYLTLVMMNKEARTRDKVIIWSFILAIMGYSWYCNWLFDLINSPVSNGDYWSLPLINLPLVGQWTVAQLTPIIVAALPVFIVAYASIAHLVHVKASPISLEDLQRQADEAQARALAKVAIMKAQNLINEEKAAGVISVGRSVIKNALNGGQPSSDQLSNQVITDQVDGGRLISDQLDTDQLITSDDQVITPPDQSVQPVQRDLHIVDQETDPIVQAIINHPGVSNRKIGAMLKVSPTTVGARRKQLGHEQATHISHLF